MLFADFFQTRQHGAYYKNFKARYKIFLRFIVLSTLILSVSSIVYFKYFTVANPLDEFLPAKRIEGTVSTYLYKRNRWVWVAQRATVGALAAVAGISGQMAATSCLGGLAAIGNPACWITAVVSIVASAAAYSLSGAGEGSVRGGGGGGGGGEKRSLSTNDNSEYLFWDNIEHAEYDDVSNILQSAGLELLAIYTYNGNSTLSKRSDGDGKGRQLHTVHWKSSFGNHVGARIPDSNLTQLAVDITHAEVGAQPVATTKNKSGHLEKRWNYFDVEWTSYSYDNVNKDLAKIVASDRTFEELEYDSGLFDFFDNNHGWKYCIAPTVNPNPGSDEGYDQIGVGNALHGELYFNTYGGIDGFCNDDKDGAQCSTDGCGD